MTCDTKQSPHRYSEISFQEIMHLYDYHPWQDGKNPRIDHITHTILNIKRHEECRSRTGAINYFTKILTSSPRGLSFLTDGELSCFAVVPSHAKGHVSEGLLELVRNISAAFNFENEQNLLVRLATIDKAATGGERSMKVHFDSIKVTGQVQGKTIYLFDDITSTGSSLQACKKLLLNAGAHRVAMIALGRTYMVS